MKITNRRTALTSRSRIKRGLAAAGPAFDHKFSAPGSQENCSRQRIELTDAVSSRPHGTGSRAGHQSDGPVVDRSVSGYPDIDSANGVTSGWKAPGGIAAQADHGYPDMMKTSFMRRGFPGSGNHALRGSPLPEYALIATAREFSPYASLAIAFWVCLAGQAPRASNRVRDRPIPSVQNRPRRLTASMPTNRHARRGRSRRPVRTQVMNETARENSDVFLFGRCVWFYTNNPL